MKNASKASPVASFPIPKSLAKTAKEGDSACIVVEGTVGKGEDGAMVFHASKVTPYDQYEKPAEGEEKPDKPPKPPKETMEDDEVGEGAPPPPKEGIRCGSKTPARIAAITGYPEDES